MKTFAVHCFLLILMMSSVCCSKKADPNNGKKTIGILVVGYKTDSPIVGGAIYYNKIDLICDHTADLVFVQNTDSNGRCEVPDSIYRNPENGVIVSPPFGPLGNPVYNEYYYVTTGSECVHSSAIKFELPRRGVERLHLTKTNNFPGGYYLEIKGSGEKPDFPILDIARIYGFPSDTTFGFEAYREQTNTITWKIYNSSDAVISTGAPLIVNFPKTGTNEIELKY